MADTKPEKAKRRVKNPETFREKVVKAAEDGDKPRKAKRARGAVGKLLAPVFRPIGRFFSRVGRSKAFKPFKKPLRILSKVLLPQYLRDSWKELKLVTWPTLRQSRDLTIAVLIFAIIFGLIVAGVDYVLDKAFREILNLT